MAAEEAVGATGAAGAGGAGGTAVEVVGVGGRAVVVVVVGVVVVVVVVVVFGSALATNPSTGIAPAGVPCRGVGGGTAGTAAATGVKEATGGGGTA